MRPEASGGGKNLSLQYWCLRIAGSTLIFLLIFWFLPAHQIWGGMQQIPIRLWSLVLCLFLFGHLLGAAKWWLLICTAVDISFLVVVRAHFAGLLGNIVLPGATGGDIVRAGLLLRDSNSKAHIAAASIADRLVDTFASLLLAGVGALLVADQAEQGTSALFYIGLSFTGGVLGFILFAGIAARLSSRLPLSGVILSVVEASGAIRKAPGQLAACFVLSLAVQTIFILSNIMLAEAIGLHVSIAVWFFAFPLAKLLSALPISFAGLGVREASLAAMLAPFGADATKVIAVSLIWQSVILTGALIGGTVGFAAVQGRSFWARLARPTVLEVDE